MTDNSHRRRVDKDIMTTNAHKERVVANSMPKRGCGRRSDLEGSSHRVRPRLLTLLKISTLWLRSSTVIPLRSTATILLRRSTTRLSIIMRSMRTMTHLLKNQHAHHHPNAFPKGPYDQSLLTLFLSMSLTRFCVMLM